MHQINRKSLIGFIVLLGLGTAMVWSQSTQSLAGPDSKKSQAGVPVEPDMHEFMEYVFQPTYKRLKHSIATEPEKPQGLEIHQIRCPHPG